MQYVHNADITIEPRIVHWPSYFADISLVADERAGDNDARHTVPQGASCKAPPTITLPSLTINRNVSITCK